MQCTCIYGAYNNWHQLHKSSHPSLTHSLVLHTTHHTSKSIYLHTKPNRIAWHDLAWHDFIASPHTQLTLTFNSHALAQSSSSFSLSPSYSPQDTTDDTSTMDRHKYTTTTTCYCGHCTHSISQSLTHSLTHSHYIRWPETLHWPKLVQMMCNIGFKLRISNDGHRTDDS